MISIRRFPLRFAKAWAVLAVASVAVFAVARDESPEEEILAAIESNLAAVGNLTANVTCTCSDSSFSFTNGYLRRKPDEKIGIWRGATNSQVWSNSTCFNIGEPSDNSVYGFRWNDSSKIQLLYWSLRAGYSDPRSAFEWASQATDLSLCEGTEVINSTTCYKLTATGTRIWVDTANVARIIRCELDYQDSTLFCRADYKNWTTIGSAHVATKLDLETYYGASTSWRKFEFTLSNIGIGATISDSFFEIWVPNDSGS